MMEDMLPALERWRKECQKFKTVFWSYTTLFEKKR